MEKFRHIILTKFNMVKKGRRPPNLDWTRHRFNIFEKYCYPTLIGQTDQNFEWMVFFDQSTDRKLINKYQRIIPIFFPKEDKWSFRTLWKDTKAEWLITTRLDSDDGLNLNFIREIHRRFRKVEKIIGFDEEIVDFSNGINYDIRSNRMKLRKSKVVTAFLTTIEKMSNNPKGCYVSKHTIIKNLFKNLNKVDNKEPMWFQVIHDKNIGTKTIIGSPINVDPKKLFNIDIK